ncbi:MAG: hypothetical protein HY000_12895 [Planctomycetes bacterium]|nr:hypothetical protein [Planctomycetota bacterium]
MACSAGESLHGQVPAIQPMQQPAVAPQLAQPSQWPPPASPLTQADVERIVQQELSRREAQQHLTAQPEAAPATNTDEKVVGSELDLKLRWNHGLEAKSASGDFRVHVGGRTHFDGVWLTADDTGLAGAGGVGDADAAVFRRGRLAVSGTLYEVFEWAVEYDFFNTVNDNVGLQPASDELGNVINVPAPTDIWWEFKHLPVVGALRIGNMKEPIGLEHQTSSRFLDFMERSFNQDAFTGPFNNGFTPGIMLHKLTEDKRATMSLGVFKNATNAFAFDSGDGEYAVDGRVSCLPWYDEPSEGRYLLHLGISGSHRDPDDGRVRIRSRASLRNGPGATNPVLADTGFFFADSQDLLGGEAALVYGPWLLQAEYIASLSSGASVGGVDQGTVYSNGYYAEVLYFLTGEHRPYDHDRGAFTRIIPHSNAFLVRTAEGAGFGPGAWQVAARYSQLDLNDSGIQGGVIEDVTLGLNWFLNPNMKLQFNYVYTRRDALAGVGDIYGFGTRLAMDF